MTDITLSEARSLAMAAIAKMAEEQRLGELMIIDDAVVETDQAWYFPYDSTAYALRGGISSALAGNLPVKVARDGGRISYEVPN